MEHRRYVAVHAWLGNGDRLGMLEGVQVSQLDSTAHA